MRLPARTLRRAITMAIVTMAMLAGIASMSLVGLTTILHRASVRSTEAVESVRLTEEVQRDILLHDRVRDPVTRAHIASGLRERLAQARARVRSPEQRQALDGAALAVAEYFAADEAQGHSRDEIAAKHAAAFAALEALGAMDLDDARRAYANVERYDRLADVIGIVVSVAVVVAAGLVVWWLNMRALRPLSGLQHAMRSFGHGNVEERAEEDGPSELAEMARCFNEMATSIARRRRERQTFIAGVAHDLRNPLSVLRMSADLAQPEGQPLDLTKVSKVFDAVRRQVGRLERMVGDLLDMASVEAGNLRLHVDACDLRIIVLEMAEHYRHSVTKHVIDVDLPDEEVRIDCDAMRIEQVVSNLVSNAIKYSPKGGRVALSLVPGDDEVTIMVRDEGIGMSEEDAVKAFEPFRRSAPLRDQVAGSGLGLFVVRRLVEAHGGRVEVNTAPGAGSTFVVRLPRSGTPL
ncbi:MAG: Chemotaxis protein methyltransferase CheR [Myxococcaceae bacterium]|nr:Chemotaxis protein methyltransferase CheR [Myxococcaceae bacterium]